MEAIQKYAPFFVSALLMGVLLHFIYPHYQYYIDPDGTAYLTISQRYANGDYLKAINGYWSPWSCWLTAMLIKTGIAAIPASVIINTTGAIGFLYISQSFFRHFGIVQRLQWLLCITLAFFLCFAVFWQSFDDLWECFFLLSALRLMLFGGFKNKPVFWVIYGMIGALAYFAKAYSFPFFILSTLCCTWFISKGSQVQWLKISLVSIGVMILCSLPWIIALHHKYDIWTTSTAGALNTSWYLIGHPYWKNGIDLLIPPTYANSPYYWEDPYFANGITPHFWNSFSLFGLQILRIGYNAWKLLKSMLQLSVLFPLVFIDLASVFVPALQRSKKIEKDSSHDLFIVGISFFLFLSGYLLVNFESRYIWYLLPLGMVVGGLAIQNVKGDFPGNFLIVILPLTFLIYPANCMKTMYDQGANEYKIATQLKQLNIQGTFTGSAKPGIEIQRMERLAYFSGNQFYSHTKQEASHQDLLQEMRRYHVNYYFALKSSTDSNFVDEQGNPFPEITNGGINGLKVYVVNVP